MILNLEEEYPGILETVMVNFEKVKKYAHITRNWEDALKKVYLDNQPIDVIERNKIEVPDHLLGKEVREITLEEAVKNLKSKTGQELVRSQRIVTELYNKKFTYEWLSKNASGNKVVAMLRGITNRLYRRDKARVIDPNMQNLVIRNLKGDIVSKGTAYINRNEGYIVINGFEIGERYRNQEEKVRQAYGISGKSKSEQDRELIFSAFQRGIMAFIEEYNKQNPTKPIRQVNLGEGNNQIRKQVSKLKKSPSILEFPSEEEVRIPDEQYILYDKDER